MAHRLIAAALLFGSALVAVPASAADYLFTVTGPDVASSFSFVLPDRPVVTDFTSHYFSLYDVASNRDFFGSYDYLDNYSFSDDSFGGGFTSQQNVNVYSGPALFSYENGAPNSPVFKTGNFQLTDYTGQGYTVTIADRSAVPEPATWALMIAGFGVVGAGMRRRHGLVRSVV